MSLRSLAVCACERMLEAADASAVCMEAAGRSDAAAALLAAQHTVKAALVREEGPACLQAAGVQQALARMGALMCEAAAAEAAAPEVCLRAAHAASTRPCASLACPNLAAGGARSANRKCSGCRQARFCCEACSHQAWRQGHRTACKLLRDQAAS